jgi:hypothetical protein
MARYAGTVKGWAFLCCRVETAHSAEPVGGVAEGHPPWLVPNWEKKETGDERFNDGGSDCNRVMAMALKFGAKATRCGSKLTLRSKNVSIRS